ncbi:DUF4175 domain-containing protein [Roseiterribacter gracilis]|uniref:ATPase n=1 Tax=Roseiterribacter gracilis TaxID=2812848 RepID=A0A8S8X6I3_9PROT|nr:ATPase [Rhodospirillales bacterium TMPK1]
MNFDPARWTSWRTQLRGVVARWHENRLPRLRGLGTIVLWLEALARAFWPVLTIVTLFLALAFFDVLPRLASWLHWAVLLIFAGGLIAAVVHGVRGFVRPATSDVERRLERDGALAHRPLETLADRPVAGDARLWALHRRRAERQLSQLRLSAPDTDLAPRDPRALRVASVLVLLLAISIGWGELGPRLSAALTPPLGSRDAAAPNPLDLWIKPPAYTGLAPIIPAPGDMRVLNVPIGSTIEAHVATGRRLPTLQIDERKTEFEKLPAGGYVASTVIDAGTQINVRQGWSSLGSWPIRIVPDKAPLVGWTDLPHASERGSLVVPWTARDDYGVRKLTVTVTPNIALALPVEPVDVEIAIQPDAKDASGQAFVDLASHFAAGFEVTLRLTARDALDQAGKSEVETATLPERAFRHPVARVLIQARKTLITEGMKTRRDVARMIAEQAFNPERYGGSPGLFLTLRSVTARLLRSPDVATGVDAAQALWDVAIQLEDQGLGEAEKALRAAEEKLQRLLADPNSTEQQLADAAREASQALDRYLDAMREQMREMAQRGELIDIPDELADQMMSSEDLRDMAQRMRELAESGARESAQRTLEELRRALEGMRGQGQAGEQGSSESQKQSAERMKQAMQALKDLKQLEQQQRQLMDDTFQSVDRTGRTTQGQQQQQEQLRQKLGQTTDKLNQSGMPTPDSLGRADRAMNGAGRAMQRGAGDEAVARQGEAVQALREGSQQAMKQMAEALKRSGAMVMRRSGGTGGMGRDPFGRPMREGDQQLRDNGEVKIPGQPDTKRVREILEELRRRSGETNRPQSERDYIDRLLRQF